MCPVDGWLRVWEWTCTLKCQARGGTLIETCELFGDGVSVCVTLEEVVILSSLKRSNCLLCWFALIEYNVEDTSFIHYSSFSIRAKNSFEFLNHLITFQIRDTRQHYIYAPFAKTCVCHDSDLIFRFILNPLSTKTFVFDSLHEEECRWARPWP